MDRFSFNDTWRSAFCDSGSDSLDRWATVEWLSSDGDDSSEELVSDWDAGDLSSASDGVSGVDLLVDVSETDNTCIVCFEGNCESLETAVELDDFSCLKRGESVDTGDSILS